MANGPTSPIRRAVPYALFTVAVVGWFTSFGWMLAAGSVHGAPTVLAWVSAGVAALGWMTWWD